MSDYFEQLNITGLHQLSLEQIKQCRKVWRKKSSFWWQWWDVMFPISPWPAGQCSAHHPHWQKLDKLHDPCLQKPKAITVELRAERIGVSSPNSAKGERRERRERGKEKEPLLSIGQYVENLEWKKHPHDCCQCSQHEPPQTSKLCLWPSYLCVTSHNKTWTTGGNLDFFSQPSADDFCSFVAPPAPAPRHSSVLIRLLEAFLMQPLYT